MSNAMVQRHPASNITQVWRVPTMREWLASAVKRERWIIPGFIPHDSLILVSGQQKLAFKTWFTDALALTLVSGKPISLLEPVEPVNVLYCQEEGSHAGTGGRIRGLCQTYKIPEEALDHLFFAFHNRVKLDDKDWRNALLAACIAWNVKVVLLDAMTYMHDGDENKVSEMQPVVETLQMLRANGVTVVFNAHLDKDRGSRKRADIDTQVRGASIVVNAYDMHFALRRYSRKDAHIDLTLRAREQEEREYAVTWNITNAADGETVERAELGMRAINEETQIEATLVRCAACLVPNKIYSATSLRTAWGVASSAATQVRNRMIQDGILEEVPGGFRFLPKKG